MSRAPDPEAAAERRDAAVLAAFAGTVLLAGLALLVASRRDIYPGRPPATGALVVRGGTLFDGTGRAPTADALVVVRGDRIACVGATCPIPEGALVVDAAGAAVLPGLIDLETYFTAPAGGDAGAPFTTRMWDIARLRPAVRRALLAAGVTTIRNLGDVEDIVLELRRGVAAGELAGPRVYVSVTVTAPSGVPVATTLGGNVYVVEHAVRQAAGVDAARQAVRALARDGVDGVTAVSDGGVLDRLPRLAPETLAAAVSTAHAAGLWAAADTSRIADVRAAAAAGADTIERGALFDGPLDPATVELMRARGVTFVPTLAGAEATMGALERGPRPPGMADEVWQRLRGLAARPAPLAPLLASVRAAHEGGVRIGAGTANGAAFGTSLQRELELLVEAGLTPAEALLAATRNAARALGAARDLGTVEAGKLADLVLVAGRPWEGIGDVRSVRLVIQAGRVVVGDGEP